MELPVPDVHIKEEPTEDTIFQNQKIPEKLVPSEAKNLNTNNQPENIPSTSSDLEKAQNDSVRDRNEDTSENQKTTTARGSSPDNIVKVEPQIAAIHAWISKLPTSKPVVPIVENTATIACMAQPGDEVLDDDDNNNNNNKNDNSININNSNGNNDNNDNNNSNNNNAVENELKNGEVGEASSITIPPKKKQTAIRSIPLRPNARRTTTGTVTRVASNSYTKFTNSMSNNSEKNILLSNNSNNKQKIMEVRRNRNNNNELAIAGPSNPKKKTRKSFVDSLLEHEELEDYFSEEILIKKQEVFTFFFLTITLMINK